MLKEVGRFTKKLKLRRSKHWEGRQKMPTFQELSECVLSRREIFRKLQVIETNYSLELMGSGKI